MKCDKCSSDKILSVFGKCNDCSNVEIKSIGYSEEGYLPQGLGIGGGDYIEFLMCLDCGKVQGSFPIDTSSMEDKELNQEDILSFYKEYIENQRMYKLLSLELLKEEYPLNNKFYKWLWQVRTNNAMASFESFKQFVGMFNSNETTF